MCKRVYKENLEDQFGNNDCGAIWKTMAGICEKRAQLSIDENVSKYANRLNDFYFRFNKYDFQDKIKEEMEGVFNGPGPHDEYIVSEDEVACVSRKVNERKSSGPYGLKGWILKHCS
ncbi:Non-LTR (Long terminal repeat) retrotransposon and domain-containing protein [Elysia marginata]|uniref:Non-LTR (Long terminal repeat) retrotransposon and domain-containing protein n=1 Tax=Elysia marginata TaxID=1093978 RepID=A0AAV4HRY6_9GAST|nr:Non-LTR (Long terminal repeat) retrotransposon and domain-containing protein [Elysia marginata]